MISVICITNRPGGIDVAWGNMKRQTFKDFEFIIVDGRWKEREKEVKEYINDDRLVYIHQLDKKEGALSGLAHADNQAFEAAKGELLVLIQDYIWTPPDTLERYWNHYKYTDPEGLFSAVGNQYKNPNKGDIVDPNGKITVFEKPFTGRPDTISWADPRINSQRPALSLAQPVEWELSHASIPRSVIYDIGGMDPQFDYEGFAWDNTYIAYKAHLTGRKIYLDQNHEYMAFDHDGWWPNPLKVEKKSPAQYFQKKVQAMIDGKLDPREHYI